VFPVSVVRSCNSPALLLYISMAFVDFLYQNSRINYKDS
jgi:hypothetical protein